MSENQDIANPRLGLWGRKKLKKKFPHQIIKHPAQFEIYGKQTENDRRKHYLPIKASEPGALQLDICDMRRLYSPQNNNVKYLFFIVDVFSRYLWLFTLTSREQANYLPKLISKLNEIKKKIPRGIKYITSDNEFKSNLFMSEIQKVIPNVKFKFTQVYEGMKDHSTGIVERLIGTIRLLV
jgi:hypothetical protein